jgi:two-component sensor histidine kinase
MNNNKKVWSRSFFLNWLMLFLNTRPRLILFLLLLLGLAVSVFPLYKLSQDLIETTSIQDAALYAEAISEFRTLYTSEVVARAEENGLEITHDYYNKKNAIPLPATMSILLGNEIAKKGHGGGTKLYSKYPFPWRAENGGLQDSFARAAWQYLNKNPNKPYFVLERKNGIKILRYAVADIMRPSCINCHNTHKDSPKRNWKVGDVRGVLEVSGTLDKVAAKTKPKIQYTIALSISMTLFILTLLSTVIRRLRDTSFELETQLNMVNLKNTEKDILLREIHHRVKNNLQIITSLLNIEQRQSDNQELKSVLLSSRQRIEAMSFVHEKLFQQTDLANINLTEYLYDLSDSLLFSFDKSELVNVKILTTIDNLNPDFTINIGLITAELITNSIKYGFKTEKSNINIQLNLKLTNAIVTYEYSDNGIGLESKNDFIDSNSFGFKLIDSLIKKLKGELIQNNNEYKGFYLSFFFKIDSNE